MKKICIILFLIFISCNLFADELLLSGYTKSGEDANIYMLLRLDDGKYKTTIASSELEHPGTISLEIISTKFVNVFQIFYKYYLSQEITFPKNILEDMALNLNAKKSLINNDSNEVVYTATIE